MINEYKTLFEKNGEENLRNLGIDGRIILKGL
jgi:hypothetical protein